MFPLLRQLPTHGMLEVPMGASKLILPDTFLFAVINSLDPLKLHEQVHAQMVNMNSGWSGPS